MRAVVQRVSEASVSVDGRVVAAIGPGLLALIGVTHDDTVERADALARKLHGLRILRAERSLADGEAEALIVSQFTLYGDARRGRRPTWAAAAPRAAAEPLVERVATGLQGLGVRVQTGVFGADMRVGLINDGPCTVLVEL